jgi:predicted TIM-barrel fold metal-dependent hydrolase
MRIDAGVGFVDRTRFHYPWMEGASPHMNRDFTPDDLWRILSRNRFEGAVARPLLGTPEERQWLRELRAGHAWIRTIVEPREDVVESSGFPETPPEVLAERMARPGAALKIRRLRIDRPAENREFVQWAFERFGPDRLMWASDWPFCMDLGRGGSAGAEAGRDEIGTWKESLAAFTQALGPRTIETREQILGGTAARVYGFS